MASMNSVLELYRLNQTCQTHQTAENEVDAGYVEGNQDVVFKMI